MYSMQLSKMQEIKEAAYLVKLGVQGATELHVLHQIRALPLIGRDDANLIWFCTSFQQFGGDLFHISSFCPVGGRGGTSFSLQSTPARQLFLNRTCSKFLQLHSTGKSQYL